MAHAPGGPIAHDRGRLSRDRHCRRCLVRRHTGHQCFHGESPDILRLRSIVCQTRRCFGRPADGSYLVAAGPSAITRDAAGPFRATQGPLGTATGESCRHAKSIDRGFGAPGAPRGILLSGLSFRRLRRCFSATTTIAVSAALFGVAHVVMGGALGWERLVPSILLGVILGWVCWTSSSVIPGMLLHACHNAILTMVPSVQELPPTWLVAGVMGSCAGAVLVWMGRKRTSETRA